MTDKPLTRQQAIRAHCKNCIFNPEAEETWVAQVEACTKTTCSLYIYRPLTAATRKVNSDAALEEMTPTQRAKALKKKEQTAKRFKKARSKVKISDLKEKPHL